MRAQFRRSIATGGSPAGEKAREQQPLNRGPTSHEFAANPSLESPRETRKARRQTAAAVGPAVALDPPNLSTL